MRRWHVGVALLVSLLVSIITSHFNPGVWSWKTFAMNLAVILFVCALFALVMLGPEIRAYRRIYRNFRKGGMPRRVARRLAWQRIKR